MRFGPVVTSRRSTDFEKLFDVTKVDCQTAKRREKKTKIKKNMIPFALLLGYGKKNNRQIGRCQQYLRVGQVSVREAVNEKHAKAIRR